MTVTGNIRRSGAITALAAVLMVRGTAAGDRPIHEIQITASQHAFDPLPKPVTVLSVRRNTVAA